MNDTRNSLEGIVASKSKAKGNRFEKECVEKLKSMNYKDVKRAWGSNGLALGHAEDVDILADGIKIQCKVRKTVPKWLALGTCDWVLFKEDRGAIYKITRLEEE